MGLIVCITEGIKLDMIKVKQTLNKSKSRLIGHAQELLLQMNVRLVSCLEISIKEQLVLFQDLEH